MAEGDALAVPTASSAREADRQAAEPRDGFAPPASSNAQQALIEDVLGPSEEPGAVLYMSRIREVLREGNPAFAEELLGKMRQRYASSVLVDEAAVLVEESHINPPRWQP